MDPDQHDNYSKDEVVWAKVRGCNKIYSYSRSMVARTHC